MTTVPRYAITIQIANEDSSVPTPQQLQQWACHALQGLTPTAEICLRIVSPMESQQLNASYRQQDKPTNVLSFAYHDDPATAIAGDLILCAAVIADEAQAQQKSLAAHWAHMITHGILHLAGFDHGSDADAHTMEQQEIQLLAQFGFANPYQFKEGLADE